MGNVALLVFCLAAGAMGALILTAGLANTSFVGVPMIEHRRIATIPPLIALVLALILSPVAYPPLVSEILGRLGGTLAPLALVSVGLQLRPGVLRGRSVPVACGLGVKLLLAPLVLAVIYLKVFGGTGTVAHVPLFEAAMDRRSAAPSWPLSTGLDPPLVTLMVGIGSIAAFLTLPMWWYGLQIM